MCRTTVLIGKKPSRGNDMGKIEQVEMDRYRKDIASDVRTLVDKYRAIFGWDVPDIDQHYSDKIILMEMQKVLHEIEDTLLD
jgi:hypothetical protein